MDAQALADQTGKRLTQEAQVRLRELTEMEYPTLIPMLDQGRITKAMWFV